jgi:hypothetical protein
VPFTFPRTTVAVVCTLLVLFAASFTDKHPPLATLNLDAVHDAVVGLASVAVFGFHGFKTANHTDCLR